MSSLNLHGNKVGIRLIKPIPLKWQNMFLYGYCSTFAVAMKELYKFPVYKIHGYGGILHCFNRISKDVFIDVRGKFHKKQMYDYPFQEGYRLEHCNYNVVPFCDRSYLIAKTLIERYFQCLDLK